MSRRSSLCILRAQPFTTMPATPSSRLPRPADGPGRRSARALEAACRPLGPPADPQAGHVHVLDRRRFHLVADHLDDAVEAPGAASSPSARRSPEPGRRRTDPPSTRPDDLRARAGSATGRPPWPRSARHTAAGWRRQRERRPWFACSIVVGRAVAYEPVSPQAYEARLLAAGIPGWRAFDLAHITSAYSPSDNAISPDGPMLGGRRPRSLSEFLQDHRDLFPATCRACRSTG